MRHAIIGALVGMLVASWALAEEPGYGPYSGPERGLRFDAPPGAGTPSPWACSVETLLAGESCIFDSNAQSPPRLTGEAKLKLQRSNQASAASLGGRLCPELSVPAGASTTDAALAATCLEVFERSAGVCGRLDDRALLDDGERFAVGSEGCYASLRDAVERLRQAADVWSSCCTCLEAEKCAPSRATCAEGFARGDRHQAARTCMIDKCSSSCSAAIELTAPRPPVPAVPGTAPARDELTPTSDTVDL